MGIEPPTSEPRTGPGLEPPTPPETQDSNPRPHLGFDRVRVREKGPNLIPHQHTEEVGNRTPDLPPVLLGPKE